MHDSNFILSNVLKKITSSAVSIEKACLGDYYISRTGVYCRFPGFESPYFIGGFSCKKNPKESEYVSRCEVAERVLATYYFSLKNKRDTSYSLNSIVTDKNIGFVSANDVLLGPTLMNNKNLKDAVGLAFHTRMNKAISHAVYELAERNILGKIWYENHPLIQLSEINEDDIFYSEFTIKRPEPLPFVMSVLHNKKCNFLCVGAAFTDSTKHSQEKSKAEAIMLAHNILRNKSIGNINNDLSKLRFTSQSNQHFSRERKKFISAITHRSLNNEKYEIDSNFERSLAILNLHENNLGYCILHESIYGNIVRAISSKLVTLQDYRKKFQGTEKYSLDPIC